MVKLEGTERLVIVTGYHCEIKVVLFFKLLTCQVGSFINYKLNTVSEMLVLLSIK